MTDAVEAAREELWRQPWWLAYDAIADRGWSPYLPGSVQDELARKKRTEREVQRVETDAAIRADERAKVQPMRSRLSQPESTCGVCQHGLGQHYMGEFAPKRCLQCTGAVQSHVFTPPRQYESALRAAVQDLLAKDYGAYMSVGPEAKPEDEWDEYDYLVIPAWRALKAALDGAPYEPSDAEVESGVKAIFAVWGVVPHRTQEAVRAVLKAAWGGGGDD